MTENYNNENFAGEVSEYVVSDKVLAKITKKVVDNVDGVLDLQGGFFDNLTSSFSSNEQSTSGISVNQADKDAVVEAGIILEYGKRAEEVFRNLDKAIKNEVKNLTGINVKAVKVNIVDILTKEEFNKKQKQEEEEKKQKEI
ncbi:Asp23/Gls24 family envelope stress response protein [Anaerococcus sp.]|uniref:Asp23/Gls24 family envelope stress response protein n=1 Tax=Anaerococcus sp. TaxID=1872515 RepID=UPI0027B9DB02|nr:Asp23/Gls24 family envelope stress response protein [Anaerococcus sp.]